MDIMAHSKKHWITPDIRRRAEALVADMTLEEKVGQMTQYDWGFAAVNPDTGAMPFIQEQLQKGLVGSLFNLSGAEEANRLQKEAMERSRHGIPLLIARDVIHGYRTVFPIPMAQSMSWNPDLVWKAAAAASREAATDGIAWVFAPMVDISRDPRWGRVAEGMGEDPFLAGEMAEAWVAGAEQNDWTEGPNVASCPKHFAAYGFAEAGRDYNTVDVSDRVLREVILPPFRRAVEAGALSLMASFNELNGIPATANRYLLTTILREEWGFEGILVSDYNAVRELIVHGVAADEEHACELAIKAGLDMDMHSGIYARHLPKLAREGRVSEDLIDQAVFRILAVKLKLGLFENPFVEETAKERVLLSPNHVSLARELARESIVLLKNDGVLPLAKTLKSVAVIGPFADNQDDPLGCWSFDGRPEDVVPLHEGVRAALPDVEVRVARGCDFDGDDESGFAEALAAAAESDAVIVAVGENKMMSGESHSKTNIDLPGPQRRLIEEVAKLGKPFVVVLHSGRPLTVPWLAETAPAVLAAWHLGVQAGPAIADVLFGDCNPSGRLTFTFPRNVGQIPIYYYRKNTGRPPAGRYTSFYLDSSVDPLYPFGYGLSYTRFDYADLQLSAGRIGPGDVLEASVNVTNAGDREGDETVQLYVRDLVASVTQPLKKLIGYRKIRLAPGETKTVTFRVTPEQLAILDADMRLAAEAGTFRLTVGPNSSEGLTAEFELTDTVTFGG